MCNCAKPTTWYNRLFAWLYDPLTRQFEQDFLNAKRKQLLEGVKGRILEVGCGTGVNFPLYPSTTQVVACEPSAPMLGYAYDRLEREKNAIVADIELVHAGIGDEALENYVPEAGFDAIVCTLVLCTVPDQNAAIDLLKKMAKTWRKIVCFRTHSFCLYPWSFATTSIEPPSKITRRRL